MPTPTPFVPSVIVKDSVASTLPATLHGPRSHSRGLRVGTALGLERQRVVADGALAAMLDGATEATHRARLDAALAEHWGVDVASMPLTALSPLALLDGELAAGDALWLSPALAARHRESLAALSARGVTVASVEPGALASALEAAPTGRMWLYLEGLAVRRQVAAPFEALSALLARHADLHLLIDDSGHMGWCGRGGRGRALTELSGGDRRVVVADLSVAFGAEVAVVATERPTVLAAARLQAGAARLDPSRFGAALALAGLHAPASLAEAHGRLAKRLQLCDVLLKGHRLPAIASDPQPHRFVAAGSAAVAYAVAARMLERGHVVGTTQLPDVGAALRFPVTLGEPREVLQALVEALAQELGDALASAGSSLDALGAAHGLGAVAPQGAPVDFGAWRSGKVRTRR